LSPENYGFSTANSEVKRVQEWKSPVNAPLKAVTIYVGKSKQSGEYVPFAFKVFDMAGNISPRLGLKKSEFSRVFYKHFKMNGCIVGGFYGIIKGGLARTCPAFMCVSSYDGSCSNDQSQDGFLSLIFN